MKYGRMGGRRGILACIQQELCVQNLHGGSVERTVSRRSRHSSPHKVVVSRRLNRTSLVFAKSTQFHIPSRLFFVPLFTCPPAILESLRHPSADFPFINSNFVRILSLLLFYFQFFLSLSLLLSRSSLAKQQSQREKQNDQFSSKIE